MSTSGLYAPSPAAREILGWMVDNQARQLELITDEFTATGDISPSGDAAVRAHLRFVAEGLAATAGPEHPELTLFADTLPERLEDAQDALTEHREALTAAANFEADLQFGAEAAADPSLAEMLERRIRVAAWMRLFVEALDQIQPDRRPISHDVAEWMAARQRRLAGMIFAMDKKAKLAEIARAGRDAVNDPAFVNHLGQAAMLQAHVQFLVEALSDTLRETAAI
jgi:hypothetical protein